MTTSDRKAKDRTKRYLTVQVVGGEVYVGELVRPDSSSQRPMQRKEAKEERGYCWELNRHRSPKKQRPITTCQ